MIYKITSKTNDKIKQLIELRDARTREKQCEFLIEGFHLVEMALTAGVVIDIYTLEPLTIRDDITQYIITKDILKKITVSKNPQGIMARCKFINFTKRNNDRIIYLDGLNDPGNVGTIIRTALGFGFKVILGEKCASLYNEKVIASSQGAIFACNIEIGDVTTLIKLKEQDYELVGASLYNAMPINKMRVKNKMVIVVGNESHGISEEVLKIIDQAIVIPIEEIESLNVAIASSIMMYAVLQGIKE